MTESNADFDFRIIIVGAAAAVLVVLGLLGCYRWSVLEKSQTRRVPVGGLELMVGLGLFLFGMAASSVVADNLGLLEDVEGHPSGAMQHAILSLLMQGLGMMPAAIFTVIMAGRKNRGVGEFGLSIKRPVWILGVSAAGLVTAMVLVMGTLAVSQWMAAKLGYETPELGHDMLVQMTEAQSPLAMWLMIASAVILAPLLEETIYRGLVQTAVNVMLGWSYRWLVVLIAAALFTSIHIGGMPGASLPGIFVLGVMLGWIYERWGNLWVCILIHAGFNALNIAMVFWVMSEQGGPAG